METSEIRELSDNDLKRELENALKERMNLRFRHSTKQLSNTSELNIARKKVAKIKTIIRERELQGHVNE